MGEAGVELADLRQLVRRLCADASLGKSCMRRLESDQQLIEKEALDWWMSSIEVLAGCVSAVKKGNNMLGLIRNGTEDECPDTS